MDGTKSSAPNFDKNIFKACDKMKTFVLKYIGKDMLKLTILLFLQPSFEHIRTQMFESKGITGIINHDLIGIGKAFLVYFPEIEAMNDSNDWATEPFAGQVVYNSLLSVKLK